MAAIGLGALGALGGLAAAPGLLAAQEVRPAAGASSPVRFAPERDYGPFVYEAAPGRIEGLSMDVLRLIQERTGLRLQMLPARPLAENLAAARRGEADLLSSLRPTPERSAFLLFSLPYVSVPAVLVVREPVAGAPRDLAALAGQAVAVGAGYAVEGPMRRDHPKVAWQAVSDDVAALEGLAGGRFRAAVVDAASLAFVVQRHGLRGLSAVAEVGFDYRLSFAVRKELPALKQQLDEAIVRIGASEREALLLRWLPQGLPAADGAGLRAPLATRLAWGLLLVALVLAVAVAWRRRRER